MAGDDQRPPRALAVVLAAGAGTRFTAVEHKLRSVLGGRAVVQHAVDAARGSGLPVVVVVGAVDLADLLPDDVAVVVNDRWVEGQATSVQAALACAGDGRDAVEAVVVGLGDQPGVEPAAWRAVAAAVSAETPIAVATYGGRRANPVALHRSVWPLLPTTGDEVGRVVMRSRPELVREIPCPGHPGDIDTMEDLNRWSR